MLEALVLKFSYTQTHTGRFVLLLLTFLLPTLLLTNPDFILNHNPEYKGQAKSNLL